MAFKKKETPVNPPQVEEKQNEVMDQIAQEAPKPRVKGAWVKMTPEEVAANQRNGKLVGWDPKTQEGLLKD